MMANREPEISRKDVEEYEKLRTFMLRVWQHFKEPLGLVFDPTRSEELFYPLNKITTDQDGTHYFKNLTLIQQSAWEFVDKTEKHFAVKYVMQPKTRGGNSYFEVSKFVYGRITFSKIFCDSHLFVFRKILTDAFMLCSDKWITKPNN